MDLLFPKHRLAVIEHGRYTLEIAVRKIILETVLAVVLVQSLPGVAQEAGDDVESAIETLRTAHLLCAHVNLILLTEYAVEAGLSEATLANLAGAAGFHSGMAARSGATAETNGATGQQFKLLWDLGLVSPEDAYSFIFEFCDPLRAIAE